MTARHLPPNPEAATDVRLLARYYVQHEMAPDGAAAEECRKAFIALLAMPVVLPPAGAKSSRHDSHARASAAAAPHPGPPHPAAPHSGVLNPGAPSVGDILTDPQASMAAITQVKKLAKRCITDRRAADLTIPREAALVLYYLSIAVGQLRHATLATTLPADVLYAGMHWAEHLPWMDRSTKQLLTRCRRDLQVALARGLRRKA